MDQISPQPSLVRSPPRHLTPEQLLLAFHPHTFFLYLELIFGWASPMSGLALQLGLAQGLLPSPVLPEWVGAVGREGSR